MTQLLRPLQRLPFATALLLAPVAYCVHQIEESSGGFRLWRARHFAANNPLHPEQVFALLTGLGLLCILAFTIRRSRPTAAFALLFYLTMQLHNVLYHVGAGLVFADYSPGTISAIVLYLPINVFLLHQAIREGYITSRLGTGIVLVAGVLYWSFELIGPVMIGVGFLSGALAVLVAERRR